ncbi:MAG: hypothetical protein RL210_230 [Pseudomonadota bacterium]|jgi:uncharacterized membrane protein SirB2|nr:hypothetical protein [Pseudomonadota bacterium]
MSYLAIKHLHVTCVVLSILLFFLRGIWTMQTSPIMQQRWVKIAPHIIDTLLLGSALTLAWLSQQWPFQQAWLTAKVLGLLAYIILGSIALKRGKTRQIRLAAWLLALVTVGYIVAVALSRSPAIFSE